jgi:hypothetical protein
MARTTHRFVEYEIGRALRPIQGLLQAEKHPKILRHGVTVILGEKLLPDRGAQAPFDHDPLLE